MPIHRYTPQQSPCKLCGDGFDHRQSPGKPDLTACPTCGQKVSRAALQDIYTPKLLKPISVSEAKSAGFKIFKRTSGGEFERQ
ncbi:hypothetical protein IMCC26134_04200 [Verrucomicrobia bacterium IMCC26134]|nr:hypothetical protein IMCC26134_04200 [Verrucomicrobia bacterium IMCC26134]